MVAGDKKQIDDEKKPYEWLVPTGLVKLEIENRARAMGDNDSFASVYNSGSLPQLSTIFSLSEFNDKRNNQGIYKTRIDEEYGKYVYGNNPIHLDFKISSEGELVNNILEIVEEGDKKDFLRANLIRGGKVCVNDDNVVTVVEGGIIVPYDCPPDGYIVKTIDKGPLVGLPAATQKGPNKISFEASDNSFFDRPEKKGFYFMVRHHGLEGLTDPSRTYGPLSIFSEWESNKEGKFLERHSSIGYRLIVSRHSYPVDQEKLPEEIYHDLKHGHYQKLEKKIEDLESENFRLNHELKKKKQSNLSRLFFGRK